MSELRKFTEKLEKALYLTSNVLEQELIADISVCIHANEGVIAFEILCSNLYEFDLPISKETYELLEDIGTELETKKHFHENLKPLIIPNS